MTNIYLVQIYCEPLSWLVRAKNKGEAKQKIWDGYVLPENEKRKRRAWPEILKRDIRCMNVRDLATEASPVWDIEWSVMTGV